MWRKISKSILACMFCLPEVPPTPPSTPDIPYAIPVNLEGLPRSDSDYSLGPTLLEELRRIEAENQSLKLKVQRLQQRIDELETMLVEL